MKAWLPRLLLAGLLVAAGLWVWKTFFPSPETVIRQRMAELAGAASFGPKDGALTLLGKGEQIVGLCAEDVRVKLSGGGFSQALKGRQDIRQAVIAAHANLSGLSLRFPDVRVQLGADQQTATVNANGSGQAGGRDLQLIELRFTFRKVGGDWLIESVENASTFD